MVTKVRRERYLQGIGNFSRAGASRPSMTPEHANEEGGRLASPRLDPTFPTLLSLEAQTRPDVEELRQLLSFAFSSGVSGGLFAQAAERSPMPASTWDTATFAADLFLDDLVRRSFRVRVDGYEAVPHHGHLLRVLSRPPSDPRVIELRRGVLRELVETPALRRATEHLYVRLCRLRTALEGATAGKKIDPTRRQLDVLVLLKEIFEHLASSFEGSRSALGRLGAFGERVTGTEAFRSMVDLLDYDEHLATLGLTIRVGADGRVRGFDVLSVRERKDNPFVLSPARRWLSKAELFLRGYRFGDGEVMARLLDAVFEGMEDDVLRLLPLLAELEVYLGALGFRDLAATAGLEVCLPELDAGGAREVLGLFNPLLIAGPGGRAVPCDVVTEHARTTLLITGPNSGGKTRLLQSLALTQLLGQSGMFVPARSARLVSAPGLVVSLLQETRFDQSEGRLGMELLRIRALFEQLGPGTMVVLDELCSGTNPSEGEEIFELVIALLAKLRPQAFITTHFLTFAARLARQGAIQGLGFLQVELDPTHKPTYQFTPGVATTSLASHAAARLGVTRDELDGLIEKNLRAVRAALAMATFLTSPRMNPALRARVERAVSPRVRAKQKAAALGYQPFEGRAPFALARLLPIAAFALVLALGLTMHAAGRRELEAERGALLGALAARRAGLPPGYQGFVAATDRVLAEAASESPLPDFVDPALDRAGFDALVQRPSVYVHAAATELRDAKKLDDAVGASIKDPFLWCLLRASTTGERELLAKVRGTYFGGAKLDEETATARRLGDARMGLDVLGPTFEDVVRHARDIPTLKRLKKVLDAAPAEQAARAAAAEILIVVSDGVAPGGEKESRVSIVEIATQRLLLRVRPRVEGDATGAKAGAHREQVEGCGLALAVRRKMD